MDERRTELILYHWWHRLCSKPSGRHLALESTQYRFITQVAFKTLATLAGNRDIVSLAISFSVNILIWLIN